MSLTATLLFTSLLVPAADGLEGTWRVEQVIKDGRAEAKTPDARWIFAADTLAVKTGDEPAGVTSKYTSDDSTTPASIDLTVEGKEKIGIYEVSGGVLRVAVSEEGEPGDATGAKKRGFKRKLENTSDLDDNATADKAQPPERPTGFGKNNERVTVYVFRRVVNGDGALAPVIKRPPPGLPEPPKGNALPAASAPGEKEKPQWPKIWRGRYFLPASK